MIEFVNENQEDLMTVSQLAKMMESSSMSSSKFSVSRYKSNTRFSNGIDEAKYSHALIALLGRGDIGRTFYEIFYCY